MALPCSKREVPVEWKSTFRFLGFFFWVSMRCFVCEKSF